MRDATVSLHADILILAHQPSIVSCRRLQHNHMRIGAGAPSQLWWRWRTASAEYTACHIWYLMSARRWPTRRIHCRQVNIELWHTSCEWA